MKRKIKIEKSIYGNRAVIQSNWDDSMIDTIQKKNVKELELNDSKGWKGDSISFLSKIKDLESLIIIDLNIKSLESVHELTKLKRLELITYANTPIDFERFDCLEICAFEWIKGSDSLFNIRTLTELYLNNYKGDNDVFHNFGIMQSLSILNSSITDLHSLSNAKDLNYLRLGNLRRLKSLNGIEELKNLKEVEIQKCKDIQTLSELFDLKQLNKIIVSDSGKIQSIKGIDSLIELQEFLFYESTNIEDGDLKPLFKLPNLRRISFQNRRHYSHTREDFGKLWH